MYCFSQICRICLGEFTTEFMNVHAFDYDKIKIHEKLRFCVPEIVSDSTQLPENVCSNCWQFLQQMYNFKQMCIENTNTLHKYALKLSNQSYFTDHIQSNLYVAMNPIVEEENQEIVKEDPDGVSMFSISLNQWDLFETKFTCRCIKEYGSFTENTEHLCKNCEGDLHGFRLSKIKVGIAENRYNNSLTPSQLESDDSNSTFSRCGSDKKYEKGFDYNDILLCKVHVNGVNKQINELNDNKLKYNCTLCDKSYTRRYNLYNHYVSHQDCKFFYCPKCNNKFITEQELEQHDLVHRRHTSTPAAKKQKNKNISNLTSDDDFDGHNLSIKPDLNSSEESLNCSKCSKVFDHKSKLAIHLMTHSGKNKYECKECGKDFFRKQNFDEHKRLHKQDRKYKCPRCEKSYNHKSNLRRHEHIHEENKYLCSICNEKFFEKEVLEDHIFSKHTKPKRIEEYPCPTCAEIFQHVDHLKSHELFAHSNTKPQKSPEKQKLHTCRVCQKNFIHIDNLRMHLLTHSDKKAKRKTATPFKVKTESGKGHYCPICDRVYSIKTNIRKHLETHTSGKIVTCTICQKKFTNMYLLRQHIQTHTEELNYKCELCEKAYLTKTNLVRHVLHSHSRKNKLKN